jgi:hypothetical protein
MKIEGSGSAYGSESGSISQRHGSADPHPDPDPHQNVMDPQHWSEVRIRGFGSGSEPKCHGSQVLNTELQAGR